MSVAEIDPLFQWPYLYIKFKHSLIFSLFVLLPLPLVAGTLWRNEIEGIEFKGCSDKGMYELYERLQKWTAGQRDQVDVICLNQGKVIK